MKSVKPLAAIDTPPHIRLEEIFARAAALPEAERTVFLDAACAGEPALRAEVEMLLLSHQVGGFMKDAARKADIEAELARLKPEEAGERFGNYKLLEQIGEGGFGTVWVADQEKPMRRRVALKIIKLGMDTKEVIARFEQERQALAMMDHPNIARVIDAGATQWGRPYFVMELVRGIKITDYCDQTNLSTADRLALFAQVCNAVQHAHQKGIIHRDLKPSNILVTLHDDVPVPKVIDFGVAKATQQQRLTDLTIYTQFQQMIGTPLYMSPEQAEMSGLDIDTRSDIYSLGVLLYELLTGRTPFDPADLMKQGLDEIRRTIREVEPQTPSMFVRTMADETRVAVARNRRSDPAKLTNLLRGDLDWIVMKALEKDRTRRYATANGFAEDIRRYLANEPVTAAAPSAAYLFGKFARRYKAPLGIAALIAVVLVAAMGISLWKTKVANEEKKKTADALEKVDEKKAEVEQENRKYRAMLGEAASSDRAVAEEMLRAGREREAFAHLARACEYDPLSTFAAQKAVAALNTWQSPPPTMILTGHEGGVRSALFSRDGSYIVTASSDSTARVWDAATAQSVATLTAHTDEVKNAQFSPDGAYIVTASWDKTARVWDAATWECVLTLTGHEEGVASAQYSQDGAYIVTASNDNTARVWDAATGECLAMLVGHAKKLRSAQFSPDGAHIVTASWDKTARVWDAATWECVLTLTGHKEGVNSAQFSKDGARVVTAADDKTARVWDAVTGRSLVTLTGHEASVDCAQFSPDGALIVTASDDKTARVWDAVTGKSLGTLGGHAERVRSALFSTDGLRVVTASSDKTARVWDATPGRSAATREKGKDGSISGYFGPDGARVIPLVDEKTRRLWNKLFQTSTEGRTSWRQPCVNSLLVFTVIKNTVRVSKGTMDQTLVPLFTIVGHGDQVNSTELSPDGARIVTASGDGTARVWDAATGQSVAPLEGHTAAIWNAQFNSDGTCIVTASADNSARVWDATTWGTIVKLTGHESGVNSAYFSKDGAFIVTASADRTARVWNAASGICIATLQGHERDVLSAQFSPDGSLIVTAAAPYDQRGVRLWDAATGECLASFAEGKERQYGAQFSEDATGIITASSDRALHMWTILPTTAGLPPAWFADFLRYMAQMRLNSNGELKPLKPGDWLALRERMRAVRRDAKGQDTPYLRILRRFVPE